MTNLIISIIYLLLSFSFTILIYKKYGKIGLFSWICILVVICNIQTIKLSSIFGLNISLGNISYGALFLTNDILSEKYGEKTAKKACELSFVIMIIFSLLMYIFLQYIPSDNDFSQQSFETIFNYIPRVTIGSLVAYYISQRLDVKIYALLKDKYNKVWISNNVSTIVSQIADTFIFVLISFYREISMYELLSLMITMIVFKVIIAIFDTPFMLYACKVKKEEV